MVEKSCGQTYRSIPLDGIIRRSFSGTSVAERFVEALITQLCILVEDLILSIKE